MTTTGHMIVFTSSATEANATVLRSVVDGYRKLDPSGKSRPHVVMSSVEHSAFINMARSLAECGYVDVSFVKPDRYGFISSKSVDAAIRDDTVLVCVMHANNETGTLNDIPAIVKVCHGKGVPIHVDCVQTFGKMTLPSDIDSLSFSSHKFGGLTGAGGLVMSGEFVNGYGLAAAPTISGSQNYGFRGGTENVPGIFTGYYALEHVLREKSTHRSMVSELRRHLIDSIRSKLPCRYLSEYLEARDKAAEVPLSNRPFEIIFLTDAARQSMYLPGIVLFAITKWTSERPEVCNVEIKSQLLSRGFVVSVGSACSTKSPTASHVVSEMNIPQAMRKGVIRVSLSHTNTKKELDAFVAQLVDIVSVHTKRQK
jgi:cysteine desulfurase